MSSQVRASESGGGHPRPRHLRRRGVAAVAAEVVVAAAEVAAEAEVVVAAEAEVVVVAVAVVQRVGSPE
jgi:hypothetical protein